MENVKGKYVMNKVELLAPAGSMDSLKAAVQNGANAVYIGGSKFGARAYASNFDEETINEAVEYAHIRDVKIYVTLNTLVKESEIEEFRSYVEFLYNANVDALILQDLGVIEMIIREFPDFEIHASTQMTAHSVEDVKFLKKLGFSRVVVSRELTTDQILNIKKNVDVEIEAFVHGALCISYSGQCLMSSLIGGRSGNRGRCAQPCRKEYKLLEIESQNQTFTEGKYLLSTKDLNTIEDIHEIIGTGVESLKIEGRMKKPEYVSVVVGSYRAVIDGGSVEDSKEAVETIFNRGFTRGYIMDQSPDDVVNSQSPGNKGVYVGKVLDFNKKKGRLKVELARDLNKYDGLDIGMSVGRILKDNEAFESGKAGEVVELDYIGNCSVGQSIYKTSDYKLLQKAENWNDENIKIKLRGKMKLNLGQYPILEVEDCSGNKVSVLGEKECESAVKVSLSREKITEQMYKLGNTPYVWESFDVEVDENLSLPISLLNKIRRDAIDKINKKRIIINRKRIDNIRNNDYNTDKSKVKDEDVKFVIELNKYRQFEELMSLDAKYLDLIDCIYYKEKKSFEDAFSISKEKGVKIAFYPSRIIKDDEYGEVLDIVQKSDEIIATNVGMLERMGGKDRNIRIDWSFNVFNSKAVEFLKTFGAASFCLSPEMNLIEIKELLKNCDNINVESMLYGRQEVMISEYCPLGTLKRNCTRTLSCGSFNEFKYGLKDERNQTFPISNDGFCRSVIYNSKIVFAMEYMKRLDMYGVNRFRLNFTNEKNIHVIYRAFANVYLNGYNATSDAKMVYLKLKEKGITKGHYERGVE